MTTPAVLVVGAGPTGLVLACDLLSRGIEVKLIDRRDGPAQTSRAIGLQPRGREILERLSAADGFATDAVRAAGTDIYTDGRHLLSLEQAIGDVAPLLIGQDRIEKNLRERIAALGGEILWAHELTGLQQQRNEVIASLKTPVGPHHIGASWVVGCDGAHSAVRKLLDLGFEGTTHPETMVLADVEMRWDRPHDRFASWLNHEGLFAAAPLPSGKWRLFAEIQDGGPFSPLARQDALPELPTERPEERLQLLFRERTGEEADYIVRVEWLSVFRFHQRLVSHYRIGRCFLAGDAAHVHSAQGAQGMNLGIGDAFNLGWKLALICEGKGSEQLLDSYQYERRPEAQAILRRTGAGWRITLGKTWYHRVLRDRLVLPIMRSAAVQRRIARTASQLDITYRAGPLAKVSLFSRLQSWISAAPVAGDRAPDVKLRSAVDGSCITLGQIIGNQWALLQFSTSTEKFELHRAPSGLSHRVVRHLAVVPQAASNGDAEHIENLYADYLGEAFQIYRPEQTEYFLIRPDGHIGCRTTDMRALANWWSRVIEGKQD